MDVIVYGADSETYRGQPMTLQFFSEDTDEEICVWVCPETSTAAFIDWANTLPTRMLNVVYCHNLEFDLPEFLWEHHSDLISVGGDYAFDVEDWHVHGVYGKPTFCRMRNEKTRAQIMIVDSFSWFQGSLAKAADLFCPDLPKLKRPANLGTKKFKMNDQKFYDYAMRDSEVAYHIGIAVQKLIKEFNIAQPVSLADMSAKIFRHHFLVHTIPQPARGTILNAMESYHGGKNNVVQGMAPGWHMDITGMDISSAYPYAMSLLPSMSYKKLYKRYRKTLKQPREVPPLGIYTVSGEAFACDWPVIFEHGFQPIQGKFRNVNIQGYELNEALRSKEIRITSIRGNYYQHESDNKKSPFAAYVNDFYERKESESDPILKYMYKLILNSVYGKFIQTRKNHRMSFTDIDSGETTEAADLIAGGMCHPFIASAITAHTRVYIHRIEHEYQAIHTATDGIFTNRKRVKKLAGYPSSGLGSLTIESRGNLCLLRNKCYILYNDNGSLKSQYFRGKRIDKFAKHGFQGTIYDLEKLIAHRKRKYKASRPNRLRESMKRGLAVNDFVERDYTLKVGPIPVIKGR